MSRSVVLFIMLLCVWVSLPAQQTAPPASTPARQAVPATVPPPATADDPSQKPAAEPQAPAAIDPKTGLPLTVAEQREKEIDKVDPFKTPEPVDPNASRLTDREPMTAPTSNPYATADTTPLPGSVAASNAPAPGSRNADGSPAGPAYSGPAVLSRSYTLARPIDSQQISWKLSVGVAYAWDKGQVAALVGPGANYAPTANQSRSVNWGLSGRHLWKRDQLGVAYTGGYSNYSLGGLSGMNNSLNLDLSHAFSRHLTFQLVESLQTLSQNYSAENPVLETGSSVANINYATSPNVQFAGNTVKQSNSTGSMTFHQTSRLSYYLSATYFLIGRTGLGFVGTEGKQVGFDVNYRLTRKTTIGAFYSYTNYQFSHNVANSDSHSVGAIYSYALNKRTQVRTRMGGTRIESLGYESVALPAELAFILGQTSTIVNAYSNQWISDVSVELARDFGRNRTASLGYTRGQSPGNGVLLTSYEQVVSAGYSTRLLRRLPISAGYSYSTLRTLSQSDLGNFASQVWYFGTTRQLSRGTGATFRVDYRTYNIGESPLSQHDLRLSIGLSWSPPENTLRF